MITTECTLIGSLLKYPERFEDAIDVTVGDFSHPANQIIWKELVAMEKPDMVGLVERLRLSGNLEKLRSPLTGFEGIEYLKELLNMAGTEIKEYARLTMKAAIRRQLRQVAALIMADAEEDGIDPEEALDEAEKRIMALTRYRGTDAGTSIGDLLNVLVLRLEQAANGEIRYPYTPKLLALRNIIGHAESEEYIVVAARPGQGKSSLLRFEAYHMAMSGKGVILFNLENSQIEYARSVIAIATGINTMRLRDGKLSENELAMVKSTAKKLAELPLQIITMASPSVIDMERSLRQAMTKLDDPALIMVDYIQLVRNGWAKNNVENVTISSNNIRGWSLKYKIPVMVAAQLNREIERRGQNTEPELSDLRESGALEQDATMVVFPRPVWNDPTPAQLAMFPENKQENGTLKPHPVAIPIKLHLKKSRNTPTGISEPVLWNKSNGQFKTLINFQ